MFLELFLVFPYLIVIAVIACVAIAICRRIALTKRLLITSGAFAVNLNERHRTVVFRRAHLTLLEACAEEISTCICVHVSVIYVKTSKIFLCPSSVTKPTESTLPQHIRGSHIAYVDPVSRLSKMSAPS